MSATTNPGGKRPALQRLAAVYRTVAILLLNTIVLFVLLNALIYVALAIRDKYRGYGLKIPILAAPEASLATVYPDMKRDEWRAMLLESWSRQFAYEDYVMFKERPHQGQYVNVREPGFRQGKDQGPWPPDPANVNLFFFGGSTMFGYGLPDEQTVPSRLQECLALHGKKRLCVYNFGTGYYNSVQERILLERLFSLGFKPDIAVFVDGLNDFYRIDGTVPFHEEFQAVFDESNRENLLPALLGKLPMGRIIRKARRQAITPSPDEKQKQVRQTVERYRRNKTLVESVCRSLAITPLFVWQPVPDYRYDLKHHLFIKPDTFKDPARATGYAEMEKLNQSGALGDNFLWCADLQQDERECVYVDSHHYTAKFAKKLAETICRTSLERGLLKPHGLEAKPDERPVKPN